MIGIYKLMFTKGTYIGQSTNIEKRIGEHCRWQGKGSPLLEVAFLEHEYLGYKVIETCDQDNLNNRECYWIKKLKPTLNTTAGGTASSGTKAPRSIYTKEQVLEVLKAYISNPHGQFSTIAKLTGVRSETVHDILKGRTHRWAYDLLEDRVVEANNTRKVGKTEHYTFYDPAGRCHTGSITDLENTHNLIPGTLDQILKNKFDRHCSGWTKFSTTWYELITPTGEVLTLTYIQAFKYLTITVSNYVRNRLLHELKPSQGYSVFVKEHKKIVV